MVPENTDDWLSTYPDASKIMLVDKLNLNRLIRDYCKEHYIPYKEA